MNMYTDLILAQYGTVCFQIIEELVTKELPSGIALNAWDRLHDTFQTMPGASNKTLCKKMQKRVRWCHQGPRRLDY